MALDFNVSPFFDDYDEDKKFYRILFRPGYPVQARELTQLQTILQRQVKRHGDHIFKQGAMVIPGQISYDLDLYYIRLVYDEQVENSLDKLVGQEIQNITGIGTVRAKVISYDKRTSTDPITLYVKYQNSSGDLKQYDPGNTLRPVDTTLASTINVFQVEGLEVATTTPPIGKASSATITKGVYYINNYFVLVDQQILILDKYGNQPSYKIGLTFNESISYPEDDNTLLDNALGSPNYSAPGAARHYIDLVLSKVALSEQTDPENFIELLRLNSGKVLFKIDRTQYAELEKTLARRTYDESGDYALAPYSIQVRNFRNNYRGSWAASEKYIQGDIVGVPSGLQTNYFVSTTSGSSGTSTPAFSTGASSINDNTIIWEYEPYPNFNRGLNTFESGSSDYTSSSKLYRFNEFTVNDHKRMSGMLAVGIEANKAYVRGYEIEKIATDYVYTEKSRDLPAGSAALSDYLSVTSLPEMTSSVSAEKTTNISVSMGSYILSKDILFAPDLVSLSKVNLHNVVKSSAVQSVSTALTNVQIANSSLANVQITGIAGQFSCTATTLFVGQAVTISGTLTGSGSITNYASPSYYKISATNGSTTFTLINDNGSALVTTAGTTTGLAFSVNNVFTCNTASGALVPGRIVTISGTNTGTGSISGYNDPTDYIVSSSNTNTHFTLTNLNGAPLTLSAGTTTGLTFTVTSAGTVIGSARIKAFEYDSLDGVTKVYKLFLFDIQMNAGKSFQNVLSIKNGTANTFECNVYRKTGETITTLYDPQNTSMIYSLTDYAVKNITELDYTVVASLSANSNSSGVLSLNVPNGYTFESQNNPNNYYVFAGTGAAAAGQLVNNSIVLSSNNTVLTINGLELSKPYIVFATIKRSNATNNIAESTLTLTDSDDTGDTISLTTESAAIQSSITINKPYVTRVVSIKMSTNKFGQSAVYATDISDRYTFINGQSTSAIGKARILLKDGAPYPTGPIQIKYEYLRFTETSPGNILSVDSYTHTNSRLMYDHIGTVLNVSLRDSIDFRPREATTNFETKYFPKYATTCTVKYNHYLPKVDVLSLSSSGQFTISKGIPSLSVPEPSMPSDSMKICRLIYEPYTFDTNQRSIAIDRVENKRYTMRDIGKLERRIEDLEYYTSLSLLELDTKNMRIIDSNGLDRFQNGFLVDTFDGQGVGNSSSAEWNASVDMTKKELRPFFSQQQLPLLENRAKTTKSYTISGDIVTLPFTETTLIEQSLASVNESVNPYDLYTWTGILGLNPWSDTWFATERRPDIVINDEGQYNAVVAKAEEQGVLGTIWQSWQTVFSSSRSLGSRLENLGAWSTVNTEILNDSNNGGSFWRNRSTFTDEELAIVGTTRSQLGGVAGTRIVTVETSAVETQQTRAGTRTFITDRVDSRVLEDRVVDTQIIPYIRQRAVLIYAYGLKADTRLYSFFDGTNVDKYITPATRLQFTKITGYPSTFDTQRNCGSNVQQNERLVNYNTGVTITGTIQVTNNSTAIVGTATNFINSPSGAQLAPGDIIVIGDSRYTIATVTSDTAATLTSAYTGATASGINVSVIGPKHSNLQVEIAFNHGEVIKEYINGVATGRSAIVVGQEVNGSNFYVYVLNEVGDLNYSTNSNAYFEGEYGTTKPRIKYVANSRTTFSSLQSTFSGQVHAIFRIPNNPIDRFRTGVREFKLSDDAANIASRESTRASALYEANGLLEIKQRTIIATRTAELVSERVSDQNTVITTDQRMTRDTGWYDPLAQTFLVQQDGGAFVTSIDVYFSQKDDFVPVRIELREVVNGYPGSVVLPFSRVEKRPSDVVVDSQKPTVATNFKFVSPIFLQNGVEYALVILSDSAKWRVWVSQTDTIDKLTDKRILSQPYNGVLFKSQNASAWTADQTQDLKFKINKATFTSTSVDIELITPRNIFRNLGFNPFNFVGGVSEIAGTFTAGSAVITGLPNVSGILPGAPVQSISAGTVTLPADTKVLSINSLSQITLDKPLTGSGTSISGTMSILGSQKMRVSHLNHGFKVGDTVKFKTSQIINTLNGISASHIFRTQGHTIDSVETDMYVIDLGDDYRPTSGGQTGGGFITSSTNYNFQVAMADIADIAVPGTSIDYTIKTLNRNKSVIGYTELIDDGTIISKENKEFDVEKTLPSYDNHSTNYELPLIITANLNTTNNNLSPVLDLGRMAITLIDNKIDAKTIEVNDIDIDEILILADGEIGYAEDPGLARWNYGDVRILNGNTIRVNSGVNLNLYNNLNRLSIGNVIRLRYSGVVSTDYHYTITNKYFDDKGNIFIELQDEQAIDREISTIINTNSGQTVDIHWLSHYNSEVNPNGGSTTSKYVTKKVNFSRNSTMLKVMFSAIIPDKSEVYVYYKTGLNSSGLFDVERYHRAKETTPLKNSSTEFIDVLYDIEDLSPFDTCIIKLVFRSVDKSRVPRIKDFRVIACAS